MRRTVLALALLLAAGGCSDLDSPAEQDAVLQLTVSPRALPADGFSSAQVVAEIDPRSQERYRDITFSTTLGSFPAGTSSGARTIVAAADADGRAVVVLRSAAQPGTATVTAEVHICCQVSCGFAGADQTIPAVSTLASPSGKMPTRDRPS
jgi:hypothetical protein